MSSNSGTSEQIITLSKGGGELKGIGEKFEADLHMGTGNFTIPIILPHGRNNFYPQLSLQYSTGFPNGPFGLGWKIGGVDGISRKTSKGIPQYIDRYEQNDADSNTEEDGFILDGFDDLVRIKNGIYRPRIEGVFAKIQKVKDCDGQPYWIIKYKNGICKTYGKTPNSRIFVTENGATKIYRWLCDESQDPFGNKIVYTYKRDTGEDLQSKLGDYPEEKNHSYNQLYLQSIEYVDYAKSNSNDDKFLFKIEFDYGEFADDGNKTNNMNWNMRPDRFSNYRSGFEIRTARLCKRILIKKGEDSKDDYELSKIYDLKYAQDELTNISLLKHIIVTGYGDGKIESFPPLSFEYTKFELKKKIEPFLSVNNNGGPFNLPDESIGNRGNYEILNLFDDGLPCVVNSTREKWYYWRNVGNTHLESRKEMKNQVHGIILEDRGVQFADVNGDGSVELLETFDEDVNRGYYRKDAFNGDWSKLIPYSGNKIETKRSDVRLVDLDGDGVVDILKSSDNNYFFYRNTNCLDQLEFAEKVVIPRKRDGDELPDFGEPGTDVRLADMSGDGLLDIVLVTVDFKNHVMINYWPNLGYGKFGKKITVTTSPIIPSGDYDHKRLFITDVNGDGVADIIYVNATSLHFWINQSGNSFSKEISIAGTPDTTNPTSVRIADMKGTGTTGILWTYNELDVEDSNYTYLDFTGGIKPLLLNSIDNNIGAKTVVKYRPSTDYYLEDLNGPNKWKTRLPFPIQVVALVEVIDEISHSKLTTEYRYHHGYWDGIERELHGFGRVDQFDSEVFEEFNSSGLHQNEIIFNKILPEFFSPPTETRTWFHQGAITRDYEEWTETDFSDEFWSGDPQKLSRPTPMMDFLKGLQPQVKREALRSLRGSIIRKELFALDKSKNEKNPYTVTEYLHGIGTLPLGETWPNNPKDWQQKVFFPHILAQRTTQWERGSDPMNQFEFMENYDKYGQSQSRIFIAVPRSKTIDEITKPANPYLVIYTITKYAQRDDEQKYIVDRIASIIKSEIQNDGSSTLYELKQSIVDGKIPSASRKITGQILNFYDGQQPFQGLPSGKLGDYGALVRTESLALTKEILDNVYKDKDISIPPYLTNDTVWTQDYPQEFRDLLPIKNSNDPTRPGLQITPIGYGYSSGTDEYIEGYFVATERRCYDFHHNSAGAKGLITIKRDPLGHDTSMSYDTYSLLPVEIIDAVNMMTKVNYDYNVLKPNKIIDPNGNYKKYTFTPLGFLESISLSGKEPDEGDKQRSSVQMTYELEAFIQSKGTQPISMHVIQYTHHDAEKGLSPKELDEKVESVEYYDGFGRLVQTRTRSEDVIFSVDLPVKQSEKVGDVVGQQIGTDNRPSVLVSGWQVYDNKGQVVEKYEPFFSTYWEYEVPTNDNLKKVTMYYDPRGHLIRTVNADGSEQLVIYGKSHDIENTHDFVDVQSFDPSPWEIYTYDANDNGGRTHPVDSIIYKNHWNTPLSIELDALGRKIKSIERNGTRSDDWYETRFTYDINGNLLTVVDALGRSTFSYQYDLLSKDHVLKLEHLDSGVQYTHFDAAGNVIEKRDSKGAIMLHAFDLLNRPTRLWAKDNAGEKTTLREILVYGDDGLELTRDDAMKLNLLGKLYKHYDESGLLVFIPSEMLNSKPYDFKGNVLEKVRYVINDETIMNTFDSHSQDWTVNTFRVDWLGVKTMENYSSGILDESSYRISFSYDALNRIESMLYPRDVDGKRKKLDTRYNKLGGLQNIKIDGIPYVRDIAYNAKRQRILVAYGNNVITQYAYDCNTFRLVRVFTANYEAPSDYTYHSTGEVFQDFGYEYDLVGNIISIHDRTKGCGKDERIDRDKLDRTFVYDPLYHLISATGREYKSDCSQLPDPWSDSIRAIDLASARGYTELYRYDIVGNIKELEHQDDNGVCFTRKFALISNSNRLDILTIRNASYDYVYDPKGNITSESPSRHFEWDHSDRIRSYYVKPSGAEPSIYVHYLYDSSGQRVKKLIRKQGGQYEVTVYVDDLFEYQKSVDARGAPKKENNTIHIIDNKNKIATVCVGNSYSDDLTPSIKYHIRDHLNSSNVVIDETGIFINREEYTPYGETSFGSFKKKRYRFTNKERDEESGLYYYGSRYYLPWLGRWMSCDPMGMIDGINLYQYVRNNPINYYDAKGNEAQPPPPPPENMNDLMGRFNWQKGDFDPPDGGESKGIPDTHDEPKGKPDTHDGPKGKPDTHDGPKGIPDTHDGPKGKPDTHDGPKGKPDTHDGPKGKPDPHDEPKGKPEPDLVPANDHMLDIAATLADKFIEEKGGPKLGPVGALLDLGHAASAIAADKDNPWRTASEEGGKFLGDIAGGFLGGLAGGIAGSLLGGAALGWAGEEIGGAAYDYFHSPF